MPTAAEVLTDVVRQRRWRCPRTGGRLVLGRGGDLLHHPGSVGPLLVIGRGHTPESAAAEARRLGYYREPRRGRRMRMETEETARSHEVCYAPSPEATARVDVYRWQDSCGRRLDYAEAARVAADPAALARVRAALGVLDG